MKPILFNTEMVRAILDNRKTVTRRVVKPQPVWDGNFWNVGTNGCGWGKDIKQIRFDSRHTMEGMKQPYLPSNILYVRETWAAWPPTYETTPEIIYKADGYSQSHKMKWRPSIHMPREAARIFLRVTDVRVERLQDMTEADAVAEGFEAIVCNHLCGTPCTDCMNTGFLEPAMVGFVDTWNSTIKPAGRALYGWEANPWVWVIGFERIRKEDVR